MKKKLLLSIDEKSYKTIKHIAIEEGATVSYLVEEYIKSIHKNRSVLKAIQDINKK